ncbi:hypothetical protein TNCV_4473521 [Trichonephila clavipes]|nr:hypothetical protein TNCV_4473521 [Trichonephila clavipes]
MNLVIGMLFYEENREMFLVPGKSSLYRKIRNIEVRYMETISLNDASRHETNSKREKRRVHIVESDECFNKRVVVVLLEMNGETLCHCEIDNDERCVCSRVGFIKSAFCGMKATILNDKGNENVSLNSRNLSVKHLLSREWFPNLGDIVLAGYCIGNTDSSGRQQMEDGIDAAKVVRASDLELVAWTL